MNAASQARILSHAQEFAKERMGADSSGHDYWHADRVRKLARRIALVEGADVFIVELVAILHDIDDEKFSGSATAGPAAIRDWLEGEGGLDRGTINTIVEIAATLSFHGAGVADVIMSPEGRCVRDADRLDAMGAIGIARAFAYGGKAGRSIHNPDIAPALANDRDTYHSAVGTTINHFHEKLLLLVNRMSTDEGKRIAAARYDYMLDFVSRFEQEWRSEV
jgi:uncharacterized protein